MSQMMGLSEEHFQKFDVAGFPDEGAANAELQKRISLIQKLFESCDELAEEWGLNFNIPLFSASPQSFCEVKVVW